MTTEITSDLIQDFRNRLGDSSKSVPEVYIISYINTALRRLARSDGLDKMFGRHDTYELDSINKDGTPAASWNLDAIGQIIDIAKLRLLFTSESKVREAKPRFLEYDAFFDRITLPDQREPGCPLYYTLEEIGLANKLVLDRPPRHLMAIDMVYSIFPKRIVSPDEPLPISYNFSDSLLEYILILHKIETTDMSTARALYEDLDLITTEIKELLAKRKGALPLRRIPRSF